MSKLGLVSERRKLRAFVGLDAKDDVLAGAASRLLAEEQTWGQAGGLAHDGEVVRLPRLAVFVQYSQTPAGGTVPDAFIGPVGGREEKVLQQHFTSLARSLHTHIMDTNFIDLGLKMF